ncbi:pheromone-processing carboxypeptidase KEX1 [Senna tora]|uniref:Pheromone-processing carboxypeptidase KEX1 n=1 Tax=Senna tora TaxID=362788 RepID=A0A834W581_9FABA|nr:pheromone-processing carboxypeptidase KEX1 [Senna tora]
MMSSFGKFVLMQKNHIFQAHEEPLERQAERIKMGLTLFLNTPSQRGYHSQDMEQSQIIGGAEECHSSESGWTMYIGSPIDDDDDGHSDDDDDNTQADPEDDHTDDSMASDASSGPSHYRNPWGNGLEEKERDEKFFLDKKEIKTKGKQMAAAERKVGKNEMVFMDEKGKSADYDHEYDSKLGRKNCWVGKRK